MPVLLAVSRTGLDCTVSVGRPLSRRSRQDGFWTGALGLADLLKFLLSATLHALFPVYVFTNGLISKMI